MLERLNRLHEAVLKRWPLNLNEIYLSSELIRIYSVRALVLQYRRLAFGRPIPHEIPIPRAMVPSKRFSWEDDPDDDDHEKRRVGEDMSTPKGREVVGFDSQPAVWSTTGSDPEEESKPAAFGSEPPSPPLTPKVSRSGVVVSAMQPPMIPLLRLPGRELGEEERTVVESLAPGNRLGGPSIEGSRRGSELSRSNNSVFSIFCAVAMSMQTDPTRKIPGTGSKCESCGYDWSVSDQGGVSLFLEGIGTERYVPLKDGFGMTERFLGKSHCDARVDEQIGRYGCIFCTSMGGSETYNGVEELRRHISGCHDKWQMLHDRDIV